MRVAPFLLLALLGWNAAQSALPASSPSEVTLRSVPVGHVIRPGVVVPGTPKELNASITLRYGPAKPRAILLLMPGFLGGAGSFDRLARQIVALDPAVAVWAIDRRSNRLEPQLDIARADTAGLTRIVQQGLPVKTPSQVAFMRDWGLDVTLRDWRVAVQEARTLTGNVFIGGHSMGGALTALYAGYDFGGQAGFHDVRGLVMLDGVPALLSGAPITRQMYEQGGTYTLGPMTGLSGLSANPYVDNAFFGPLLASRAAAQARLSALKPDDLAPAGGLTTFPATNLAAGMLQLEQKYASIPFLTIHTGQATNARTGPNVLALALGSRDSQSVLGPLDPARPVGWQADPAATTDPQDFVARFWRPLADYSEWYFPNRLTLDIAAANTGTRGTPFEQDLPERHTQSVTTPILGIAAEHGLTTENDYVRYSGQTRAAVTTHTLPGAAHLDITAARSDQVARWILDWMRPIRR